MGRPLLLLSFAALASVDAVSHWLAPSRVGQPLEVGLLPFAVEDALHPGETRDVSTAIPRISPSHVRSLR